jgi:hypothetical protein
MELDSMESGIHGFHRFQGFHRIHLCLPGITISKWFPKPSCTYCREGWLGYCCCFLLSPVQIQQPNSRLKTMADGLEKSQLRDEVTGANAADLLFRCAGDPKAQQKEIWEACEHLELMDIALTDDINWKLGSRDASLHFAARDLMKWKRCLVLVDGVLPKFRGIEAFDYKCPFLMFVAPTSANENFATLWRRGVFSDPFLEAFAQARQDSGLVFFQDALIAGLDIMLAPMPDHLRELCRPVVRVFRGLLALIHHAPLICGIPTSHGWLFCGIQNWLLP